MDSIVRSMASKSFDEIVVINAFIQGYRPVIQRVVKDTIKTDTEQSIERIVKEALISPTTGTPVSISTAYVDGVNVLSYAMINVDKSGVIPLARQMDYKVGKSFLNKKLNDTSSIHAKEGTDFWSLINSNEMRGKLDAEAENLFPNINPNTRNKDVQGGTFYSHMIPIVTATGVIPPQQDEKGKYYFNPNGVVLRAEFIDMLNAIKYGSNQHSKYAVSLDRVVKQEDFFSAGYDALVRGYSSPLFKLYTKKELMLPITRAELAYITVVCWKDFTKGTPLKGGRIATGVNVDWEKPKIYMRKFSDASKLRLSRKRSEKIELDKDVQSMLLTDIKPYKGNRSMSEFLKQIRVGNALLPLPMFMSLVELDYLGLFYFMNKEIAPVREVSRGEMTYFIMSLAKTFPQKFISKGDVG